MPDLSDATRKSVAGNVTQWTRVNREYGDASAEGSWNRDDIRWGQFGIPDDEYNLAHGDWIRLLRENGFEVEDLIEPQVPTTAKAHEYYAFISAEWARQWPAEEIWVARLRDRQARHEEGHSES